jgi:hypothetical protein
MSIDGQRASCTVDGAAFNCSQVRSLLENGAAIPASIAHLQHRAGFSFNSFGNGIFSVTFNIAGSNHATPPPNAPNDGGAYGTLDRTETHYFNVSWGIKGGEGVYAKLPARRLGKAETQILRNNIEKNLTDGCKAFITKLINQVAKDINGTPASTDILELFDLTNTSRGVTEGPDQSGFWGYLQRSPGASNRPNWKNNNLSIGLPISNGMYQIPPTQNPNGTWRISMSQDQFNKFDGEERFLRHMESTFAFLKSAEGAFTTIHELIHISVKPIGADDIELAQAALSFTGEYLDTAAIKADGGTVYLAASGIWDSRLAQACGQGYDNKNPNFKYIKKRGN